MKEYFGTSLNGGSAKGKVFLFTHDKCPIRRYHIEDSLSEIKRFEKARATAKNELESLFEKAVVEIGEEDAGVFSTQIVMLEDESLTDSVYNIITDQMVNAEVAVAQAYEMLADEIESITDDVICTCSDEFCDACELIIRILLGIHLNEIVANEPVIVVSNNLQPSDLVRFDNDKILGIVLESENITSSVVTAAKTMGFPLVVSVKNIMSEIKNGNIAILDGDNGILEI